MGLFNRKKGFGLVVVASLLIVAACSDKEETTEAQRAAAAISCEEIEGALKGAQDALEKAEADNLENEGGKWVVAERDAHEVVEALEARAAECKTELETTPSTTVPETTDSTVPETSVDGTTSTTAPEGEEEEGETEEVADVRPQIDGQPMPVYELEGALGNLRNLGYAYFDDQQWSSDELRTLHTFERISSEPVFMIVLAELLEGASAEEALAYGPGGVWNMEVGLTEASAEVRQHIYDDAESALAGVVEKLPEGRYQVYMANGLETPAMLERSSQELETAGPLVVFNVLDKESCRKQVLVDRAGNIYISCDCGKKVTPRPPCTDCVPTTTVPKNGKPGVPTPVSPPPVVPTSNTTATTHGSGGDSGPGAPPPGTTVSPTPTVAPPGTIPAPTSAPPTTRVEGP